MKFFKKVDIIIVSVIILVSVLTWVAYNGIFSKKPAKAEIRFGAELVKTVDLVKGTDMRFSIPQDKHVIFHLFEDGSICFEESDCPDKICVKTGRISKVGQTAVCLPNRIIMEIVPAGKRSDDDIDMMAG